MGRCIHRRTVEEVGVGDLGRNIDILQVGGLWKIVLCPSSWAVRTAHRGAVGVGAIQVKLCVVGGGGADGSDSSSSYLIAATVNILLE
jgi:hypothetical protein